MKQTSSGRSNYSRLDAENSTFHPLFLPESSQLSINSSSASNPRARRTHNAISPANPFHIWPGFLHISLLSIFSFVPLFFISLFQGERESGRGFPRLRFSPLFRLQFFRPSLVHNILVCPITYSDEVQVFSGPFLPVDSQAVEMSSVQPVRILSLFSSSSLYICVARPV